ncbi:hypothetical protein [Moraxella oculi]|nr:hypothetical protein [Moraxella sp. Tifton1]
MAFFHGNADDAGKRSPSIVKWVIFFPYIGFVCLMVGAVAI